jgi:RTX calcium-binding nonapeptide repeat (4 copies)/Kelch motif
MTGIRLTLRQRRRVLLPVAGLCLLGLGFAPQIASAAGPGSFGPTGSMSTPRSSAAAAPLPGGRVLVAGGGSDPLSAEIFNRATNTFSSAGIGSMSVPRYGAAAAPLPDGRVLVVGGCCVSQQYLSSAEVFNPATNTFSSEGIGSMSDRRIDAAAAPLPDGRVLVAGGIADYSALYYCYLSSAEVFDPATNTFSSEGIGSMSRPRAEAAAAPLPDGVLVAGGYYAADFLGRGCPKDFACDAETSAEIFALGAPPAPLETCSRPAPAPPATSATCRGKQATSVASNGADRGFTGTPGADVIVGLDGNDELFGLAGNDVICGGKGKDTLYGQNGNDQLSGMAGNDTLESGPGKDILKGGAGKDILKGGPGKDILRGGPGKDILKGGPGKDKQVQ